MFIVIVIKYDFKRRLHADITVFRHSYTFNFTLQMETATSPKCRSLPTPVLVITAQNTGTFATGHTFRFY